MHKLFGFSRWCRVHATPIAHPLGYRLHTSCRHPEREIRTPSPRTVTRSNDAILKGYVFLSMAQQVPLQLANTAWRRRRHGDGMVGGSQLQDQPASVNLSEDFQIQTTRALLHHVRMKSSLAGLSTSNGVTARLLLCPSPGCSKCHFPPQET